MKMLDVAEYGVEEVSNINEICGGSWYDDVIKDGLHCWHEIKQAVKDAWNGKYNPPSGRGGC